eukprot:CAMPEP_0119302172 /NCGR_PEP_ID=MMETSP1333-20130426/3830_1 /TAXON_ID=418940 /ORGANISM="Scyphosphaera apsteinii, Strain RCC1455" /LENGTH=82 /DNA_ID=CAMNT_0007304455 /DNA_START=701 /DNA_END=950 /DNA_ORIENTATION=-
MRLAEVNILLYTEGHLRPHVLLETECGGEVQAYHGFMCIDFSTKRLVEQDATVADHRACAPQVLTAFKTRHDLPQSYEKMRL